MKFTTGLAALRNLHADVCVVGAGPVGLSLAVTMARAGLSVALLESGLQAPDAYHQSLGNAELVSKERHVSMSLGVCRAVGGTSWLWGGRCLPLDTIDFTERGYIPNSGWPIREADVASYYRAASDLLGCGPPIFLDKAGDLASWGGRPKGGLRVDTLERWCDEPFVVRTLDSQSVPDRLTIIADATAVGLRFAAGSDRVDAVEVASRDERVLFDRASVFVLACGGLETARLLLNVQTVYPARFGGVDGPLGRYYMGHVSGSIANIVFDNPKTANLFQYRDEDKSGSRRRFTLDDATQREAVLPNTAFYPANPRMADPAHGSGILSALFLLLSTPVIGRRLISEGIRQMQLTAQPRYASHFLNVLRDCPRTALTGSDLIRQKFIRKRRKPSLFLISRGGEYPLHYHGEHIGRAESRVTLGAEKDALGLRRLRIDLRYSNEDATGIARAHDVLAVAVKTSSLAQIVFHDPAAARNERILSQASDGFHQIGLTRMGVNERDGVVDSHCRVFGARNLFIAGSAVFRTSGQANPTFFASALGLRLAAHIVSLLKTEAKVA